MIELPAANILAQRDNEPEVIAQLEDQLGIQVDNHLDAWDFDEWEAQATGAQDRVQRPVHTVQPIPAPTPVPTHRTSFQVLLPGASVPMAGTSTSMPKRCRACLFYNCDRRHDCPGKGGQKFCRCHHPWVHGKVRRTEGQVRSRQERG